MNRNSIKDLVKLDRKLYLGKKFLLFFLNSHQNYIYYKAIKYNRWYRYYKQKKNQVVGGLLFCYFNRKKNIYCNKYGIELNGASFGKNLRLYHGNIVINEQAQIGNYCKLHGSNCIGNNGDSNLCPTIGDNVDIGYGTIIIGNVKIGNNIVIGANSLVNKDLLDENFIYAGSPAKKIKRIEKSF